MTEKTWEIAYKYHHLWGFLVMVLVTTALYLARNKSNTTKYLKVDLKEEKKASHSTTHCDYFSGRWVYDNISYPLYKESQCSFIEENYACQRSGRGETKYQNWKWKPHHCDLPRFDGKTFLEKIRGKKLVFVGDSLNKNTYQSILCLIEPYLPPFTNKSVILTGNMYTFQVKDYNATISYYWSPYLVESNRDDLRDHSLKVQRIIELGAIEKHARVWTDSDILIFNSYAWWSDPHLMLLWGEFGSSNAYYKRVVSTKRLYEIALRTWSDWLIININRTRTKVFFMGHSPFHDASDVWGVEEGNCVGETNIIAHEKVKWSRLENAYGLMQVVDFTFHKLETRGVKVNYLNITHLSSYRKDAHPSIYPPFSKRPKHNKSHTQDDWLADCLHWCLPGVPDVWNQILYAYITGS